MFPQTTLFMVVDDMEPLRRVVRAMLKNLGYLNVLEASSGQQGLQVLEKTFLIGKPVEVILSDWQMPGMTGIEFLEVVRTTEQYAHLPFIMITAEGQREQILAAIQGGVSSYLIKPISPAVLEEKLKAVWFKMQETGKAPGVGIVPLAPPPPPPPPPPAAASAPGQDA
jgi:two-component system chemotaxis response regulator CheY